jgi:hypothetical protein
LLCGCKRSRHDLRRIFTSECKEKSLDFPNPCDNFSKQLSEGELFVFFARGLTFFEWEVSLFCATFKCVVDFLGDIRYIKERSTATEMQQTFPRTAAGLRNCLRKSRQVKNFGGFSL